MITARSYYRIMPGAKCVYSDQCHDGGFIGGDWGMDFDLTGRLPDDWRDFNKQFIPE